MIIDKVKNFNLPLAFILKSCYTFIRSVERMKIEKMKYMRKC